MSFKFFFTTKYYTIADLNSPQSALNKCWRENVKIAIVDDEPFVYQEELRRAGFNITQYDDVQDLQTLGEFLIIICDVKGVGKKFGSDKEGAYVANQLKKKYPFKVFAVYTGSTYDLSINEYLEGITILKKDISIDDWSDSLDSLIRKATNPQEIWKNIRTLLIQENVALFDIAQLESDYVNIILNKNGDFSNFPSKKQQKILTTYAKEIIKDLVKHAITELLKA